MRLKRCLCAGDWLAHWAKKQEGAYGIRAQGVIEGLTLGETQEGLRQFGKVDGTVLGHVKIIQ